LQEVEKRARGRPLGSSDQESKRQEFVVAVMRAIAEHGYKDVTVATICKAAGFSRGLIGHYFPGKDALLLHSVREVAKDFERARRNECWSGSRLPAPHTGRRSSPKSIESCIGLIGVLCLI
jgi:TetR/AcrR family transcriptional regulator, transcriptional repressor of bet genes